MHDFNSWMMIEGAKEKKGGRAKLAADQEQRERLRQLGAKGYTGTFDMELVRIIENMSLEDAKDTAMRVLEDYAEKHKKMKNWDKQETAIKGAKSIKDLQHTLTNFILAAGGLGTIK